MRLTFIYSGDYRRKNDEDVHALFSAQMFAAFRYTMLTYLHSLHIDCEDINE